MEDNLVQPVSSRYTLQGMNLDILEEQSPIIRLCTNNLNEQVAMLRIL